MRLAIGTERIMAPIGAFHQLKEPKIKRFVLESVGISAVRSVHWCGSIQPLTTLSLC